MSTPAAITSEEKIIVALACLIGILFLVFAPLSCKPGATAFSLSSLKSSATETDQSNTDANIVRTPPTQDIVPQQSTQTLSPEATSQESSSTNSLVNDSRPASRRESPPLASNNLSPTEPLDSSTSGALASNIPSDPTETTVPAESDQIALLAEQARKQNQNFLKQIEELAAETNTLKEERRERISKFAETKNEYAATLKFARDQHQEKLQALQRENKILADKLAALTEPNPPAQGEVPAQEEDPTQEEQTMTPPAQDNKKEEAPSFAQSDDDLDESRRVLVNAIRDMDPLSGDALATRYQELESQLGATSAGRVHFVSGSSQANAAEIAKIEKLASSSKADSQFLIVGFADRSGSADGNRRLSSKRAKFVAEQLARKVGSARVQAIYIGQTARFGPASENRVVEIWQIPASAPKP